MTGVTGKDGKAGEKRRRGEIVAFISSLSAESKMLVVLKTQLYGGKWEPMQRDLTNRLEGKPYIFKLANRINDDIERIEKMRQFERDFGVDLCDYIDSVD